MKNFKLPKFRGPENQIAFRGGSYSLVISAVVLAILIAVNLFASSLPSRLTKIDISSSKLYSITSNTKVVVNALDQDVTIYWVVQSGEEDDVEEIRFTLYLENENCPEVSVKLCRYDGELCLAEVDGKPVSLVKRSYAVELIEAVHAIVLN